MCVHYTKICGFGQVGVLRVGDYCTLTNKSSNKIGYPGGSDAQALQDRADGAGKAETGRLDEESASSLSTGTRLSNPESVSRQDPRGNRTGVTSASSSECGVGVGQAISGGQAGRLEDQRWARAKGHFFP